MDYIKLGHCGLQVSRLCLGTMNMGSKQWKPWVFDKAESTPLIKHALDCGINFIDLADFYSAGVGEEVVGRIVKNLMSRDELVLTTKVGYPIGHGPNNQGHSRKHIMASIDASLKRLGTDYIDIYMLHYFDINTPVEETLSAMNDIIHSGKARYTGVSTMFTWQLSKILWCCERNGFAKPINMQLQLNCAYREEEREMIPQCRDQGLGISAFSPLARGLLSCDFSSVRNKTDFFTQEMYADVTSLNIAQSVERVAKNRGIPPAQVAQAWVLNHPGTDCMLVGADTIEQINSAVTALKISLNAEECFELERNYTPCDVINDYTAGKRIAREARPPSGIFAP
ncbi:alcohol dehydrogenase [Yersinia pseudotuberculosis]|uniref:Putative oxidoreductase n=1 Tax=Yersinia pseudotuberculosis TaxID=633 RepID=A0A380QAV8_YERPU|nr:aldo/keto reductase [Yersinia pseudotuberculosis]PSH17328.1 alcohol dehydrogenase [Yersinia pseudotuberculosis]SUP83962.1 putative oxidoreductase [Yersinia pseudotuberculosis]